MLPQFEHLQHKTRRQFLKDAQLGIGSLALSSMLGNTSRGAASSIVNPLAPKLPHFAAKAKRVIYLHLTGSPPHLDLYDYKPELVKMTGQDAPDSFIKGKRFAFTTGTPKLLGTPRTFKQCGEGGVWLSDALPNLQTVADEMCVIKSMFTEQFNHAPRSIRGFSVARKGIRCSMPRIHRGCPEASGEKPWIHCTT